MLALGTLTVACSSASTGAGGGALEAGAGSETGGQGSMGDGGADGGSPSDGASPSDAAPAPPGDGGGSCPALAPCGGNVVGTWTVQSGCVVTIPPVPSCPQATQRETMQVSGTVTFRADGTYSVSTVLGLTRTVGLPASCLGGTDCAGLQSSLASQSGVRSATCTAAAPSGCTCTEVFAPQPNNDTGTYATVGTSITSPSGPAEPYCVQGTALQWQDTNADGLVFAITATK